MCLYLSYVNDQERRRQALKEIEGASREEMRGSDDEGDADGSLDWKITEHLIAEFCSQNFLQVKAIKEVHFLCLQLEKMMKEDVLLSERKTSKNA